MSNIPEVANKPVDNQHLRAALTQMSEAELKRLLDSIETLQIDLSRFVPLLNGAEPIEVVAATQRLLEVLSDGINGIHAVKQNTDRRGRRQNWDNKGGRVDYAPLYHLLSKVSGGNRHLVWTDTR